MKLTVIRDTFTKNSTIGKLYIDGEYFCETLEDFDRGLTQTTPLDEIKAKKVMHKTCIPYGTYKVLVNMSMKMKRVLPLLIEVPGFAGIRIHKGNVPDHSSGCIILGTTRSTDVVYQSTIQENRLMQKLQGQFDLTIEIKKDEKHP